MGSREYFEKMYSDKNIVRKMNVEPPFIPIESFKILKTERDKYKAVADYFLKEGNDAEKIIVSNILKGWE